MRLLPAPAKTALLAACVLAACATAQGGVGGDGNAAASTTSAGGGPATSTSATTSSTSSTSSAGGATSTSSTATAGGSTCTGGDMCTAGTSTAGGGSSLVSTTSSSTTSTSTGAGGAACIAPTVTNLTPGGAGTPTGVPQSFNETRAVEITPVGADAVVGLMTLTGLVAPNAGTVGARIYDAASQALVAEATAGIGPGMNETVAVTISATLTMGHPYMVGFFVSDGQAASATLFQPTTLPYSTGPFTVSAIGDVGSDVYPANTNLYAPQVSIETCGP